MDTHSQVEDVADPGSVEKGIKSNKLLPDESNREGIQRMLLHAFEFAVQSGLLTADGQILDTKEE